MERVTYPYHLAICMQGRLSSPPRISNPPPPPQSVANLITSIKLWQGISGRKIRRNATRLGKTAWGQSGGDFCRGDFSFESSDQNAMFSLACLQGTGWQKVYNHVRLPRGSRGEVFGELSRWNVWCRCEKSHLFSYDPGGGWHFSLPPIPSSEIHYQELILKIWKARSHRD